MILSIPYVILNKLGLAVVVFLFLQWFQLDVLLKY